MSVFEVGTPSGPARVHLDPAEGRRAWLVLGHGAGGGIGAPDLNAAAGAARAEGIGVALVEQPYRVAGRRSPAPAGQLDAAWLAVLAWMRDRTQGLPLLVGGRSSGARVACRTAGQTEAAGVLCLAFPLRPPRGSASRLAELEAVEVPTLVVQGSRDPFGIPPAADQRTVIEVRGDHSLRSDLPAVTAAVGGWLGRVLGPSVRIERARPADAELCLQIQRAAAVAGFSHVFPQDRYPFPVEEIRALWTSALADPELETFVAYADGEAVGSVCVGGDNLRTLYVVPSAWGRGVGGVLHDLALDRLAQAGVAEARLWTLTENHRARRFYEKRGWKLTGATRVVPFPPNPIDVEYAKPLVAIHTAG